MQVSRAGTLHPFVFEAVATSNSLRLDETSTHHSVSELTIRNTIDVVEEYDPHNQALRGRLYLANLDRNSRCEGRGSGNPHTIIGPPTYPVRNGRGYSLAICRNCHDPRYLGAVEQVQSARSSCANTYGVGRKAQLMV